MLQQYTEASGSVLDGRAHVVFQKYFLEWVSYNSCMSSEPQEAVLRFLPHIFKHFFDTIPLLCRQILLERGNQ